MEELLKKIVEQNERLIPTLENVERGIEKISLHVSTLDDEMQWYKDSSTMARVIDAIEKVESAIG